MKKKQLFAVLLAGSMTVGMAPAAAFAAEDTGAVTEAEASTADENTETPDDGAAVDDQSQSEADAQAEAAAQAQTEAEAQAAAQAQAEAEAQAAACRLYTSLLFAMRRFPGSFLPDPPLRQARSWDSFLAISRARSIPICVLFMTHCIRSWAQTALPKTWRRGSSRLPLLPI